MKYSQTQGHAAAHAQIPAKDPAAARAQAKSQAKGILCVAAGAVGWGLSGVCSQFLFGRYALDPIWLTAVRMILSGILLLAISKLQQNSLTAVFRDKKDACMLVLFAVLGLLLCQYSFLAAIQASNSGTAAVLQSLNVVIMAVFVALRTRTKLRPVQILSVLLAVLGTYFIATGGRLSQLIISTGALFWGIVSAVGVVSYTLLAQGIIKKWGNITVTGWGMLIGGSVLALCTGFGSIPENLNLPVFLAIAVIVVIGTAGSFSLFLKGAVLVGPVKATLLACLEPFSATLLSALLLRTVFGPAELLGFACILATVMLSVKKDS